ncbi:hypothetical protein CEP13_12870 [Cylindrospermopsis raciborskii C03]|uniref:Uncharacterized protein n=1 Tax=Cylindrospermopsis raciborskii C07 TaxID=2014886 RepID=A0ABX4WMG7_9CYAN|nr:hypothetical protein [Cylindrospermopsis raciborskii]PNJ93261.1 hypothetical protein CEP13_12870 [Cylindrospermopsis raciborskii C03]PNJ94915.1 hypothetical protein CEP15_12350 [Cylindrospermopsis raciborskii C07]
MHSRRDLTLHPPWAIALSDYPPVSSQGKILNVLRGDCITPPTTDRITPLTRDHSHLGTFHVQFPFGKTLTENVYRQRINQ